MIAERKIKNELLIKDKKLEEVIKSKKDEFLIQLLNMNFPNKYKNVSNKIMHSKVFKDSFENSRNKAIN